MKIQADVYLTTCGEAPLLKKWELKGWQADKITDKQKAMLEQYGIAYARVKYKGQASMLISLIIERNKCNLATPKQIQVLLQKGYAPSKIKKLTNRGASMVIARLLPE